MYYKFIWCCNLDVFVTQDPYGFMAHFYVVAQYVSPVLAWGFLGSDENLKEVCEYFKVQYLNVHRVKLYFIYRRWLRGVFSLLQASQQKKLEMRAINDKENSFIFPFPILPFSLWCKWRKWNVFFEDCVARVLSVNCNKSKLNSFFGIHL